MSNAIRLPIVVDASGARAEVKKLSSALTNDLTGASRSAERSLQDVETKTRKAGKGFQFAKEGSVDLGRAIAELGSHGPRPIQLLTSSLASLVAVGFNPLGAAAAAATLATGLLSDGLKEAREETERARREAQRYADDLRGLELRIEAVNRGVSTGFVERERARPAIESELRRVGEVLARLEERRRRFESIPGGPGLSGDDIVAQRMLREREVELRAQLDVLDQIDRKESILEHRRSERLQRAARERSGRSSDLRQNAQGLFGRSPEFERALGNPFSPVDFAGGAAADAGIRTINERQAAFDRKFRQERIDLANELREVQRRHEQEQMDALLAQRSERQQANAQEFEQLQQRRLAEFQAERNRNLLRGESFAGSVSSALQNAVNTTDFSAFGQNMAAVVRDSLTSALSDAFVESTGLRDLAAQGFGAARGAFGLAPEATGG